MLSMCSLVHPNYQTIKEFPKHNNLLLQSKVWLTCDLELGDSNITVKRVNTSFPIVDIKPTAEIEHFILTLEVTDCKLSEVKSVLNILLNLCNVHSGGSRILCLGGLTGRAFLFGGAKGRLSAEGAKLRLPKARGPSRLGGLGGGVVRSRSGSGAEPQKPTRF